MISISPFIINSSAIKAEKTVIIFIYFDFCYCCGDTFHYSDTILIKVVGEQRTHEKRKGKRQLNSNKKKTILHAKRVYKKERKKLLRSKKHRDRTMPTDFGRRTQMVLVDSDYLVETACLLATAAAALH